MSVGCKSGTAQDWNALKITITTEAHLRELATLVNAGNDFKGKIITLGRDIDIKSGAWVPIGMIREGGGQRFEIPFNGVFDGNGRAVKGITISGSSGRQGFFGYIGPMGTVKNLKVVNVNITGGDRVGGLVGSNEGTIENCSVSGNVKGEELVGGLVGINVSPGKIVNSHTSVNVDGYNSIGGFVGQNQHIIENCFATGNITGEGENIGGFVGIITGDDGEIVNCYATGNVNGNENVGGLVGKINRNNGVVNTYAIGNVTGNQNVGGLVGGNYGGIIGNGYAIGSVQGNHNVGGLVGMNHWNGRIVNTYATGSVTGSGAIGGLAGAHIDHSASIQHSYALQQDDIQLVGVVNGGVISRTSGLRTAEQMKQQSNYGPWDFTEKAWGISQKINNGFPHLIPLMKGK